MAAADIQTLIDEIKADDDVVDSAVIFINGTAARIQAAVDAALAGGASKAQLQPLIDEIAVQKGKASELAAAIVANTPAVPPTPPPAP